MNILDCTLRDGAHVNKANFGKKIYAVIPAKKNSSRLPNKNILPFGNSTLLEHKISQLQKVSGIDEIIVSSDSDIMLEKAKKMNVKSVKRPEELANELKPICDFFEYICDIINDDNGILVWSCCTSPLFDENLIQKALDIYKEKVYNSSEYDSLIATYKFKHFLMDNNGPINYKLGKQHTNSQDLPDLYLFTNGIIITTLENVRKFKCWFGGPKHYKFLVDQKQSIDIDTEEDYIIAKAFYNEIKNK